LGSIVDIAHALRYLFYDKVKTLEKVLVEKDAQLHEHGMYHKQPAIDRINQLVENVIPT